MNIVVLVKSAVDEAELRADQAGHPVLKGAATKMSNFDKNGVEEALKQKEANGGTVTAVSLGGTDAKNALKEAMAMGATRSVHVVAQGPMPDSLGTAFCLAQAIRTLGDVDLVVCSEGSSDTYQGQVGAMVAEFLGFPFLPFAKNVEAGDGEVRCDEALEGGVRSLRATLPAVVSMVSAANVPRYPTLLQVMVAGKKTIQDIPLESLQGADYPRTETTVQEVSLQETSRKRVVFEGTPEEAATKLLEALKREGVV